MSYMFEFPHTRTYDNDLGWLIKQVKSDRKALDALEAWKESAEGSIADLQKLLDDIAAGIFPKEISDAIKNWIAKNFYEIVGDMANTVWFGLTDAGYFVAYIPDSWDDIIFGTTGLDDFPAGIDYGHLTLSYEIGG